MRLKQHCILRTAARTAIFLIAMTSCGLYSSALVAGVILNVEIGESHGVYHVALEMILDAPFDDARAVITDYTHIYRIDPAIVESGTLDTPDPLVIRVRTVINDCIFSVCRDILRVEDVREVGDNDIYTVIVPELSNVRSGATHWHMDPVGNKTRISYEMTLEPGMFVPPLVGHYLVEKRIMEETMDCFKKIEHIARLHRVRVNAHLSTMTEKPQEGVISEPYDAN